MAFLSARSTVLHPRQNHSSTETAPQRRREKTPFITAIATFFLGGHVPFHYLVLRIMFSFQPSNTGGWVVALLLVTNSAVNPLVYAFLKRDIKAYWHRNARNDNSERSKEDQLKCLKACNALQFKVIFIANNTLPISTPLFQVIFRQCF